jgi:hypothetical protein
MCALFAIDIPWIKSAGLYSNDTAGTKAILEKHLHKYIELKEV